MTLTIEEIKNLNYRQLQAECKKHGISAKGKSEELQGHLILKLQQESSVMAPSPSPMPKSPAPPAAATPMSAPRPTPTPKGKSIDKKVVRQALRTPLPPSPLPKSTPLADLTTPRRRAPRLRRSGGKMPYLLGALLALLLAISLPLALPYCSKHDCAAEARALPAKAMDWGSGTLEAATAAAVEFERTVLRPKAAVLGDALRRVSQRLRRFREESGAAQYSAASKKGGRGFAGVLNAAVLRSVLRVDDGGAWEELRLSLADAWAGGKIAPEKANVFLFACGSPDTCSTALDDLAAAAPLQETLLLSSADLSSSKGALQARLVVFFRGHPRGVVVIPDIDKVPLTSLAVLNNVMGEYGALMRDGEEVSTTEATFLLTWQAPPAILAEDSETSFTLAAKRDLTLLLRGDSGSEAAQAVADAFRRRIDIVAPLAS